MKANRAMEFSLQEEALDAKQQPAPAAGIPSSAGTAERWRHRNVRAWSRRLALSAVVLTGSISIRAQVATAPDGALVKRALAAELNAAQDATHPMRYRLRKSTPRLTSVKEIVETRDGAVAKLVSINDQPLSDADRQREEARLDALLSDPGRQHKRKQSQQDDTGRALKVLRALPKAFNYSYAGELATDHGTVQRYTFQPNPKYNPPDLETTVLTALNGELWVDPVHERVVRLDGRLQQDVDFGWGILARLNKGGSIRIEQADVGNDQWRIVHFKMQMSGRVLIRTRVFDTAEEESAFTPVPLNLTYQQAIQELRAGPAADARGR